MIGVAGPCAQHTSILHIQGPLRVPVHRRTRQDVGTLLRQGERCIVLDLSGVPAIDAAGVGELVRAYNMTTATNGFLRIVHPNRWVREILERAGLAGLLRAEEAAA